MLNSHKYNLGIAKDRDTRNIHADTELPGPYHSARTGEHSATFALNR